jgi:hypothetical protein
LAHAPNACEVHAQRPRDARVARAKARWQPLVGELTLERKTSDEGLGGVGNRRFGSCSATQGCANASKPCRPSTRAGVTAASGPACVSSTSRRSPRSACGA